MELRISNLEAMKGNTSAAVSTDYSDNKNQNEAKLVSLPAVKESSYVSDEEVMAAIKESEENLNVSESKSKTKAKISEHDKKLSKEFAKRLDEGLGDGFSSRLEEVADSLGMKVRDLVGMMYSESTLEKNMINDSGHTGFIQISKDFFSKEHISEGDDPYFTKNGILKITQQEYLEMSAIEQLDIVEAWLQHAIDKFGHGHENLIGGDIYALNFMPACVFDENGNYQDPDGQGGGKFKKVANGEEVMDANGDGYLSTTEMQLWMEEKYQQARHSY